MNSQHTPGPWALSRSGSLSRTIIQERGNANMVVAEMREPDSGYIEANALLIAAAPDLLAALKDTVNQLETLRMERKERWSNERTNMVSAAIHTANVAITKATGND